MSINPLTITDLISRRYMMYLQTTFQINDLELGPLFKETITKNQFIKGPVIEVTPPFKKGVPLRELIDEGTLSPHFRSLTFPVDRDLYLHQERAVRKVVKDKRNIIVATGTGSGKTEIFIISVLNELFRQKEAGRLGPGVRALLLYPMNALVNDQLKRMRELLAKCPDITFGRYTGETLEDPKKALEKYLKLHGGQQPIPNERISRKEMWDAPPHILLTNYAMLEYLLLRPRDICFFDGVFAHDWSFIVLDEAHTFTGAKGIEMAMLLRRLKDRVVKSEPGKLRCIATSATLGDGSEDSEGIALFASQLFGEIFSTDDIINAERLPILDSEGWGMPDLELYGAWKQYLSDQNNTPEPEGLLKIASSKGVPDDILKIALSSSKGNVNAFIYSILNGDNRLRTFKKHLSKNPDFFEKICDLFGPSQNDPKNFVALVELAGRARCFDSDNPLLSARYHLFIRAVEGAFIRFFPKKEIYFVPTKETEAGGHKYPVFEMGACRYCGVPFLVGKIDSADGIPKLKQETLSFYEDDAPLKHFLLSSSFNYDDTNEDDEVESAGMSHISGERYILCGKCGSIDKASRVKSACSCGNEFQVPLIFIETKDQSLKRCPSCNKLSLGTPVVSRFYTGRDAVPSVLASAIYQELPDIIPKMQIHMNRAGEKSQPWAPKNIKSNHTKTRSLLVFSDSRQDAAFFAPYLGHTYNRILRRALLIKIIKENGQQILKNHWRITDFFAPLKSECDHLRIFHGCTTEEKNNAFRRWLLYEFAFGKMKGSLEELGLCGFRLVKPENWEAPAPLLDAPWELSEDESWELFQHLIDFFRTDCALQFPDGISPTDEFFKPRNFQFYFRKSGSSKTHHIMSWSPGPNYNNRRLDYLVRLAGRLNPEISEEYCRSTLDGIWEFSSKLHNNNSDLFITQHLGHEGVGMVMDPRHWEVTSSLIDPDSKWYICDRCQTLTLHNIRSVCPTFKCEGSLHPVDPNEFKKENHYRILYTEMEPVPMRVEEHTAQLNNDTASDLQQQFIDGKVNVLSCSTTFELGVDVGELQAVFMKNMPPSAANYIQRAGRAGRRIESAAFATTYCQRRSHDLTHFKDPMPFVKGIIRPPAFELENEKIIRRHIYATAIASFWREHKETFADVDNFFFNSSIDAPSAFLSYLNRHPPDLQSALTRIVPHQMHEMLDLANWGFIDDLYYEGESHPEKGLMTKARNRVREDIRDLEKARLEAFEKNQNDRVYSIGNLMRTIKKRPIIDFLSTHNIIPKYGFPVDVVEMQIMYASEVAKKLELQRDLKIAISEYAPGSQVVAAGTVWESRYIQKDPKRGWLLYNYIICDQCHRYHSVLADTGKELSFCEACNADLKRSKKKGEFIIPEFGFRSDTSKPKHVGENRPEKTYSSRVYFSGECIPDESVDFSLNDKIILRAETASQGKLAVINDAGGYRFLVCKNCGYSVPGPKTIPLSHKTPFGSKCEGKSHMRVALGHQYLTDILKLEFIGYSNTNQDFWLSLLYGLLEGISSNLGINRDDIDGCLYPDKGRITEPSIVLYDTVPGGAGHVKRVIYPNNNLEPILRTTYQQLVNCNFGGDHGHSSCYGCLRNYSNQFCHENLDRRLIIEFFESLGNPELTG